MVKPKKRRKPKTQLEPGDYLDGEEVRYILTILKNQADNGRFRTAVRLFIFQLLLNTGLRRAEAAGIEIRDLPCSHRKCEVVVRWQVGKGNRGRVIVISKEFKEVLGVYTKRFCDTSKPKSRLLMNEYGNKMTAQNIYTRVKTIGRLTGKDLHPHMLRHTYGSFLYKIEKDLMFVKDQMGHASIKTTQIYVHIDSDERKRQVSSLAFLAT